MRPSRSTAADTDDGDFLLDGPAMRETVAVFGDPAYKDWVHLYPLQRQAISAVEALLGAPVCAKAVVDYFRCMPVDGRLELSATAIGARPLLAGQIADLRVVASLPGLDEATLSTTLDLSGDTPAAVLGADAPSLADTTSVANPLRAEYRLRRERVGPRRSRRLVRARRKGVRDRAVVRNGGHSDQRQSGGG